MKIVFSLGHWGKKSKHCDRGAQGVHGMLEAHKAGFLMMQTAIFLEKFYGHKVWLLCHDDYKKRQVFANKIKAELFVAWHLNWTQIPGNYGLVLYDKRGKISKEFARILAEECKKIFGYDFFFWSAQRNKRGFNNIKHTIMTAIIFEPGFVNNIHHMNKLNPRGLAEATDNTIKRIKK
jgi:N-acetylmuramoyl-L-alanine amidase